MDPSLDLAEKARQRRSPATTLFARDLKIAAKPWIHYEGSIKHLDVEFRGAGFRKGATGRGKRFAASKARSARLTALRAAGHNARKVVLRGRSQRTAPREQWRRPFREMVGHGRNPTSSSQDMVNSFALDWLFDIIKLETKIQKKNVDTKNQFADMLTKGSFSRDEWNHFLCSFNIMCFWTHAGSSNFKSSFSQARERVVIGAMSKRGRDSNSSDGFPMANARPTNLVMHGQCKEVSPQRSGSLVNLGNDNNRKKCWLGDRKLW